MTELPLYYRFVNFVVRRVVAVGLVVVGSLVALSGIPALVNPDGTVLVNGQPQGDLFYRIGGVLLPAIMVLLGVLLFRAAPFVPKERG